MGGPALYWRWVAMFAYEGLCSRTSRWAALPAHQYVKPLPPMNSRKREVGGT